MSGLIYATRPQMWLLTVTARQTLGYEGRQGATGHVLFYLTGQTNIRAAARQEPTAQQAAELPKQHKRPPMRLVTATSRRPTGYEARRGATGHILFCLLGRRASHKQTY